MFRGQKPSPLRGAQAFARETRSKIEFWDIMISRYQNHVNHATPLCNILNLSSRCDESLQCSRDNVTKWLDYEMSRIDEKIMAGVEKHAVFGVAGAHVGLLTHSILDAGRTRKADRSLCPFKHKFPASCVFFENGSGFLQNSVSKYLFSL